TISRMLEAAGFERITVRRDPNRYPVGFLLERLHRYYPPLRPLVAAIDRIAPERLRAFAIPVHYGSMKVMATRAGMA
ncbi:MAG: hypothetical protein WD058_05060, partial [Dehalococcoidia bacterium]